MKAVIMAGGQGTRLRSLAADIPKPMIPILGKPILEYQIENLKENGIEDIILVIGYLGDAIKNYFGDGSKLGVNISYFYEDHPMGTAGALYYLKEELKDDFLLIMGDLMLSVDFNRFMNAHKNSGAEVTLFVHPNSHPYDSDIIVTDKVGKLEDFTEAGLNKAISTKMSVPVTGVVGKKEERNEDVHNQVNSGIYAFSGRVLDKIALPKSKEEIDKELEKARLRGALEEEIKKISKSGKIDLDKDVIRPLISEGKVYAYHSTEYVKDMGTPDRYAQVENDLKNGTVISRNLKNAQKCIFMDRDGTINKLCGFINKPEEIELFAGVAEAVKLINASRYLAIVITNQPVVARGECSFEGLDDINKRLEVVLGKEGAYIDDLFYCPHHKDKGFDGEISELKFNCNCRKPEPGLIFNAAEKYNIDLSASYMIGDSLADIECGKKAGVKTVLVNTGEQDKKSAEKLADMEAENLLEAVKTILSE
ncbi:MAG: HAD-IIIA family hydrolase [Eubacteriales bacterium]|nr:HAD-IIIA family hydrolase [Eubacteriales bacterium]